MSVPSRVTVLLIIAAWFCSKAYAPIYGTYPGLRSLIKEADVIAAIRILEQLSDEDLGGTARYKIQFEKALKGTPPEKQAVARLRNLEIEVIREPPTEAEMQQSPADAPLVTRYFEPADRLHPFRPSSRWVAFLVRTKADKDAAYENVNCMASTFPLSPLRDLDALKVDSLPETLIMLFRDYVDFKRTELKELERQLDAFIHRDDK